MACLHSLIVGDADALRCVCANPHTRVGTDERRGNRKHRREEDTAKVVSIADILNMRQSVSTLNNRESHFSKVWGNRTFLNISYTKEKLTPKEEILLKK